MASRKDEPFGTPADGHQESQPPAGLTFGRRVPNTKDGAGPQRGQVKGVFGVTGASQGRVRSAGVGGASGHAEAVPAALEEASEASAGDAAEDGFAVFEDAAPAAREVVDAPVGRDARSAGAGARPAVAADAGDPG